MRLFTYAERPDLAERVGEVESTLPEFMHHDAVVERYWPLLGERLPELQLVLHDEERDVVVGRGQTIPAVTRGGLPGGVDDLLERGLGGTRSERPDVLAALIAMVDRRRQGEGLSAPIIEGMRGLARREGLDALLAPVRPTRKSEYPLIPMERYAAWTRPDGSPFDPWIRLHARLGARPEGVCERSMTIEADTGEWQQWTGVEFPDDGEYVLPGALVPLRMRDGHGVYVEPNFWMRHPV